MSAPARLFPLLLHAGFVLTGVVTTLLGPLLPALTERWMLQDREAGRLLALQFGGSTGGVLLSSVLLPRLGLRRTLVLGFGAMAAGVAGLGLGARAAGLASIAVYGVGLGLAIPATNVAVAEAHPARAAAALNVLNFVWGLGATAWPFGARLMLHARGAAGLDALVALALTLVVLAVSFAWVPVTGPAAPRHADRAPEAAPPSGWRLPVAFGLLFFLYVGTENAVAGWAALHAQRLAESASSDWVLTPALFWAALLVGRGVAPWLLDRLDEIRLALAGLGLASAGAALLLVASDPRVAVGAVGLVGLGLASVFPIVIALMSKTFGGASRRVAGWMFALAGLGGAALPWLVGALSTAFGGLRAGLVAPLAGCLAMAALVRLVRRAP